MTEALHVFGINGKLLIAQAINFGLVLFVLWLVLYRPVMKVLSERAERIRKGVEDAAAAGAARRGAEEEGRQIVADVARKSEAALLSARTAGKKEEEKIVKEARAEHERILLDATERAKEEKRRILAEGKEEIARMVVLGAEKILIQHEK